MAVLPLTVTSVDYIGGSNYSVTLMLADGSHVNMVVPDTLANVEAVTIAAVALGQMLDPFRPRTEGHHRGHRRYDPRTA